jgi:hypothetical protein
VRIVYWRQRHVPWPVMPSCNPLASRPATAAAEASAMTLHVQQVAKVSASAGCTPPAHYCAGRGCLRGSGSPSLAVSHHSGRPCAPRPTAQSAEFCRRTRLPRAVTAAVHPRQHVVLSPLPTLRATCRWRATRRRTPGCGRRTGRWRQHSSVAWDSDEAVGGEGAQDLACYVVVLWPVEQGVCDGGRERCATPV